MKIKKICKQCGKEFEIGQYRIKTGKYCSRKCSNLSHTADIKEFICAKCGKRFYDKEHKKFRYNSSLVYCSKKCFLKRDFIRKEYSKTVCNFCGKELWRWRFELKRSHSFCNSRCQMNYYIKIQKKKIIPPPLSWNHPNAIATRFKKGEQRGEKYWFTKGFFPWNKGIDSTPEMKIHLKKLNIENWKNEKYLFNVFRGQMFGKNYKPSKLDRKAIKASILIHKIRRSLNVNK